MENYIDTIDLINAYINNMLSKAESVAFENRLETETDLNTLYNEHLAILEGAKRVALKTEIQAARQHYSRTKWMKYIGISVGIILVSALIYSFIFKTETPQIVDPTYNNEIKVLSDSVNVEKASTEKIEVETDILEQVEVQTISEEKAIIKTEAPKVISKPVIEKQTVEIKNEEPDLKTLESTSPELISFFKSVKKTPQIIEVNTEKEFTVTCNEGTVLTIPAKSFVDAKTGKLARGKINLEVTEFYKLSDMLLGNLTTKSDDKQLETGGMLYLDANKKGSKLKLKSGNRIQMVFNNKGKENMQLFLGEESNEGVNWKLQNTTTNKIVGFFEEEEEDVEVSYAVIEEVPVYPGCEKGDNKARRKCMSDKLSKFVSKNFNVSIAEDLKLSGIQKVNTFFTIEKDGSIGRIRASASRKELGDEAIRLIESIPKLKAGRQRGRAVKTTYYLPFTIRLEGKTINQAPITVGSDKKFNDVIEKRLDSTKSFRATLPISNSDIERYAFSTSNLGWINCDRFARTTSKKVKYKLKIKHSEGTNVKMIFKSMSSILPSTKRNGNFEFGWVPKDETVVLIAIKWKDNKLYLGKKETNTNTVLDLDLEFNEVSIQELKGELEGLNKDFN